MTTLHAGRLIIDGNIATPDKVNTRPDCPRCNIPLQDGGTYNGWVCYWCDKCQHYMSDSEIENIKAEQYTARLERHHRLSTTSKPLHHTTTCPRRPTTPTSRR